MESSNKVIEQNHETKHIIAILDLLGASEIIKGDNSENVMNVISHLFKAVETTWLHMEPVPLALHDIKCVTFSDNIALALELSESMSVDKTKSIVKSFIGYISAFQGLSLKSRFLFRGGISIGRLYMNSSTNFVWGQALVEAHLLEEKTAIYPRVVLGHQVEQLILPDTTRILKDFDGIYFVDYLSAVQKLHPDWIDKCENIIQCNYIKYAGNERILQKYGWLQHYIKEMKER